MCQPRNPIHCIVPPYILDHMAASTDGGTRLIAIQNLAQAAFIRGVRSATATVIGHHLAAIGGLSGLFRRVYDLNSVTPDPENLPGVLVRSEGDPASGDPAVDEAYDGSGTTYDFYWKVFGRNSLDDGGLPLISSVHGGVDFTHAFWDGNQMVYGDGGKGIFARFTKSLDVIAHELTHGVVSHECALNYFGQSGALNEHFADVFGTMVKQWHCGQDVTQADWLIGQELLNPLPPGSPGTRVAIRSLKAPGTAFQNDPGLGTDPQPAHMNQFFKGSADHQGVHLNSGIPNHAFYLAATAVGGASWGPVGEIWYAAMRGLHSSAAFTDMAAITRSTAKASYPSEVFAAVDNAWQQVGL